jgi:protein-tyrosine-phosphatase/DNA-binding transcriptional ArsR family regulator
MCIEGSPYMLSLSADVPPLLSLLANDIRWQLVRTLAYSDYRVQELVAHLGRPLNLVSYHLKQLRQHHLVLEHRSAADARDIYYHLDIARLHQLYMSSGEGLHPALGMAAVAADSTTLNSPTPIRILFLCTHNSARSQMAEALMCRHGGAQVEVFSAGSDPAPIHPDAVTVMATHDIDSSRQQSKSMEAFYKTAFDYVITVCDRARETCPVFPNDPERIHWSFPDPSAIPDPNARLQQFETIARELVQRISYLLILINRKV